MAPVESDTGDVTRRGYVPSCMTGRRTEYQDMYRTNTLNKSTNSNWPATEKSQETRLDNRCSLPSIRRSSDENILPDARTSLDTNYSDLSWDSSDRQQSYAPSHTWTAPVTRMAGSSVTADDFPAYSYSPRESFKPLKDFRKSQHTISDVTTYRNTYVNHALQPKQEARKMRSFLELGDTDNTSSECQPRQHDFYSSRRESFPHRQKTDVCSDPIENYSVSKLDFLGHPFKLKYRRPPLVEALSTNETSESSSRESYAGKYTKSGRYEKMALHEGDYTPKYKKSEIEPRNAPKKRFVSANYPMKVNGQRR